MSSNILILDILDSNSYCIIGLVLCSHSHITVITIILGVTANLSQYLPVGWSLEDQVQEMNLEQKGTIRTVVIFGAFVEMQHDKFYN